MNLLRNPMNFLRIVGPKIPMLTQRVGAFSSYSDHVIEYIRAS